MPTEIIIGADSAEHTCFFCDEKPAEHSIRCLYSPESLALLPICGSCENRLYDLLHILLLHGFEALPDAEGG